MRILVTGGAGFMGSNFIRHVLTKHPDYHVVNFDKLTYAGNLENVRDWENDPRYEFVRGDIADADAVEAVFARGVDAVVNYAAETHVDRSIADPAAFITTDVLGTHTLLEACRRHATSRYVQVSTDEVFGSIETGSFTEDSPFRPNSPYSASKAGGDHLCRAYFVTYGVPAIVTHSCNFIGPNQYPEKFIPLAITNLIEGKRIPLYGDGRNVREWIYTADHCAAIDAVLHHGKPGEVYNIGTGEEVQNVEIARKVIALMEENGLVRGGLGEGWIEFVADRPGHDRRYSVDSSKLRRSLGWVPEYSFDQALEKTLQWYRANPSWWQPLKRDGWFAQQYGPSKPPRDPNG